MLQEKRCEFFDWVYEDDAAECGGCKSLTSRLAEVEKTMVTVGEKYKKVKVKNAELKASNEQLQTLVSQLIVEKNKQLGGKIVAVAALVATWVLVAAWLLHRLEIEVSV